MKMNTTTNTLAGAEAAPLVKGRYYMLALLWLTGLGYLPWK